MHRILFHSLFILLPFPSFLFVRWFVESFIIYFYCLFLSVCLYLFIFFLFVFLFFFFALTHFRFISFFLQLFVPPFPFILSCLPLFYLLPSPTILCTSFHSWLSSSPPSLPLSLLPSSFYLPFHSCKPSFLKFSKLTCTHSVHVH